MKPSAFKCLKLLQANESVTTHDFLLGECGSRFGARLCELRELGYVIQESRLTDRSGSRYRLIAEPLPEPKPTPPSLPDPQDATACSEGEALGSLFDAEQYRSAA